MSFHKKGSAAIAIAIVALLVFVIVITVVPALKNTILEIVGKVVG